MENLDFRHSDQINALYADGHVGTIPFTERQESVTRSNWEGRNF
jgi:prepilin-type processing-associated H-X9-DG protein